MARTAHHPEYLGSAHTDTELTALIAVRKEKLTAYGIQKQLDLGLDLPGDAPSLSAPRMAVGSTSRILVKAITRAYQYSGFVEATGDKVFFQLVLARLVEPTESPVSLAVTGLGSAGRVGGGPSVRA